MGSIEIYYFSGTGNSLHVARELQKRLTGAELIPIISLLGKDDIVTNADAVGFVFPVHGMTVPNPVKRFIEKLEIESDGYIFAAATRGGTKCLAFKKIDKVLKKKGKALDSYFALNMASNDPKFDFYEVPTQERITEIESRLQEELDTISRIILNRETYRKEDREYVPCSYLLERLVLLGMKYAELDGARDYFYSDSKCTGCGTCERVCPSGKIRMADGKPLWQNSVKCYLCYACLNFCPRQAAQINNKWYMRSYTDKNGRYPHPYATAKDIAGQK